MEPSLPKSAKHADFVYKQIVRADELYDQDSLDECLNILHDLIENYDMAPFPRLKTLRTLSELMDWEYAEACRHEAEHLYECCSSSKHPDRYDSKFRAPLDALAASWANKPASEMSDEEVDYRLKVDHIVVKVPSSTAPPSPQMSEQTAEVVHTAKRQALENHYAKRRVPQES
ncbi:hypothetical protein KCU98_g1798, partial [Aureobasidium melanogenum]